MGLWILATLSAFFVKGLCGFANTLVFTSILGFGSSNAGALFLKRDLLALKEGYIVSRL